MKMKKYFVITLLTILIIGCANKNNLNQSSNPQTSEVSEMKLTSAAFVHNGSIPSEFTCDGDGLSPPLSIREVSASAKSLVLISDDPDAPVGNWDHWVVFNIPPSAKEISKGAEPDGTPGKNSWSKTGYGGPCPPSGTHRYFFKLYALDTLLDIPAGSNKKQIESAMQNHTIAKAELIGLYKRK